MALDANLHIVSSLTLHATRHTPPAHARAPRSRTPTTRMNPVFSVNPYVRQSGGLGVELYKFLACESRTERERYRVQPKSCCPLFVESAAHARARHRQLGIVLSAVGKLVNLAASMQLINSVSIGEKRQPHTPIKRSSPSPPLCPSIYATLAASANIAFTAAAASTNATRYATTT